ncbi:hypothetical protein [Vibrio cholerae]|nr:hypothetical protein [Vibrio cholerae]
MLMGMNSLAAYLQLQVVWVDLESASQQMQNFQRPNFCSEHLLVR